MKLKKLMLTSLAVLLAGCGSKVSTYVIEDSAPYGLAGLTGKKTYTGLISTAINQWNYLGSQEAADAQHYANFVDGLVLHNEFGVIEKNLAEKVVKDENDKNFTFTIKPGVKWVTNKGKQYTANGKAQTVQASDWVTTAKYICTYSNESPLLNFYIIFVKGAAEYYYWTLMKAQTKTNRTYKDIVDNKNYAKGATEIMKLIQRDYPAVYEQSGYDVNPLTATDIPNIDSFSRIGVKADDSKRELKYELFTEAFYFPTVLTYSAFLPTNAAFLEAVGEKSFGSDSDKILYCGPYTNTKYNDKEIEYSANPAYHNPEIVHLDKVVYKVIPSTEKNPYLYMRQQYEKGNIDGFSLNPKDEEGWRRYILGKDGQGNRENPADGSVNSRFLDTIGSMYGSNINMMRATNNEGNIKTYASEGSVEAIKNTENAFKLFDVRYAVLNALDYNVFNHRYSNGEDDEDLMNQYMVSTYTPLNFVKDDNGNDYVSTHVYEKYADAHPETCPNGAGDAENPEEGTAAYVLKPGQYGSRTLSDAQVSELAVKAVRAVNAYNAGHAEKITLPIQIEYWSQWEDEDEQIYDTETIRSLNRRLNSDAAKAEAGTSGDVFKFIPTDLVTSSNYQQVSGSGSSNGAQFDYSPVLWGWGADYGDPLTYMATYQKHGDWRDIFKFIDNDYVPNFKFVDGELVEEDLLAEYTAKVNDAMKITTDTTERYSKFAECEVMLLDELAIYVPQVNYGQGWSINVSKSAGYAMPSSNYGLAGDRMTGLWVLVEALSGEQRAAMRAAYQEAKEEFVSTHNAIDIYD